MQARKLNRFLCNLRELCAGDKLTRKVLLAPSRRVGYQWIEAVTRSGQPVLNLQVDELKYIIFQAVAPELARRGLTLLRRRQREVLLDHIFTRRRNREQGYFSKVNSSLDMTRLLGNAIRDLRLAGIRTTDNKAFEVAAKGNELKALLAAYERELARRKLADYAEALRLARELLQAQSLPQFQTAVIILPESLAGDFSPRERDFWEAIPQANRRILKIDSCAEPDHEVLADAQLLCRFSDPAAAPAPKGDGSAAVFRAVGEVNEVREVLRQCLANQIPFEEVEILHTDAQTYPPLVFETMARLFPEEIDNLPVTFSEGLPVACFYPGRALRAWLSWIREGFPQAVFVEMLRDHLLEIPGAGTAGDGGRLAALARTLGIGRGRERYLATLAERIKYLESRIKSLEGSREGAPGESQARRLRALEKEVADLNLIRAAAEALLSSCPDAGAGQSEVLAGAASFLKQCARGSGRLDNFSREKLLEDILEMQDCLAESEGEVSLDIWEWLAELVASARVGGERPRPGRIHVDSIFSGGHSGRGHTFILGMDDGRFPGAGLQDPLLLDAERKRLGDGMPTAAGRLAGKVIDFASLLARLRGKVTLSYCCRSLIDDREIFPSPAIFSICRILSHNLGADQEAVLKWIGAPVSFAPRTPEYCLDLNEWWLWRTCVSSPSIPARESVGTSFPHLVQGFIAAEARAGREFTEYDGYVPAAGRDHDPAGPGGGAVSSTQLETFGRCPLEYFFKYILGIHPPEIYQYQPNVWLDPLRKGSLLHAVYYEFMAALLKEKKLPEYQRDRQALAKILTRHLAREAARTPPPNPEVYRREGNELHRIAGIFLRAEEDFCKHSTPVCLEASIGMPSTGGGGFLDSESPVEIKLPGGASIRAKGRIDRLDSKPESKGKGFTIWDYKSGSPGKYENNPPFNQGRVLQNALYLAMVQARLREAGMTGSTVDAFGYVFHSVRAGGKRICWQAADLAGGMKIIAGLCEMIAAGCFPASNEAGDLKSHDYEELFKDPEVISKQAKTKLENQDNQVLAPMRKLRGIAAGGEVNAK